MKPWNYFLIVTALAVQGCSPKVPNEREAKLVDASVTRLLANSKDFDGKDVLVKGFYRKYESGGVSLFLSRDDADIWNIQSSIALIGHVPDANNHFVEVSGRFFKGPAGDAGMWPGMISPIYDVRILDPQLR